jgi:hypothetical protein
MELLRDGLDMPNGVCIPEILNADCHLATADPCKQASAQLYVEEYGSALFI